MHFLAADGLDGEDIGASCCALLQGTPQPLPRFAGTHKRRLLLVAYVGRRDAQRARQVVLLVAGFEVALQDRCNLRAPLRPVRHGRQKLKLQHDSWNAQRDGPA